LPQHARARNARTLESVIVTLAFREPLTLVICVRYRVLRNSEGRTMSQSVTTSPRAASSGRAFAVGAGLCALGAAVTAAHFARPSARTPAPLATTTALASALPNAARQAPLDEAARVALGKRIFFDKNLSEPYGTSCASCHDPAHGFAGNNGSIIGVALGSRAGHFAARNTPSVMYLKFARRFHLHWEEDAPVVDAYGGFFWDGRVDDLADVPKQPLLNPNEMNNANGVDIREKIAQSDYAGDFRQAFGALAEADADTTLHHMGEALAAYLTSPELAPFSSKYDRYIQHQTDLSAVELRGLRLFKDAAKGGCSECHKLNDDIPSPERSLFTDYGFDSVGVPRNAKLPVNQDPAHFDLGLCARPNPKFHSESPEFCGAFRTPSLRNVALRESFMHNGAFSSLRSVVSFYASRSVTPKRWYKGTQFDDLPAQYREYVNVDKAPYNRHAGDAPALSASEIDAIVAFLGTLTDASLP
jgi:cytochrome c peroxidase